MVGGNSVEACGVPVPVAAARQHAASNGIKEWQGSAAGVIGCCIRINQTISSGDGNSNNASMQSSNIQNY